MAGCKGMQWDAQRGVAGTVGCSGVQLGAAACSWVQWERVQCRLGSCYRQRKRRKTCVLVPFVSGSESAPAPPLSVTLPPPLYLPYLHYHAL